MIINTSDDWLRSGEGKSEKTPYRGLLAKAWQVTSIFDELFGSPTLAQGWTGYSTGRLERERSRRSLGVFDLSTGSEGRYGRHRQRDLSTPLSGRTLREWGEAGRRPVCSLLS